MHQVFISPHCISPHCTILLPGVNIFTLHGNSSAHDQHLQRDITLQQSCACIGRRAYVRKIKSWNKF